MSELGKSIDRLATVLNNNYTRIKELEQALAAANERHAADVVRIEGLIALVREQAKTGGEDATPENAP